MKVLLKRDHYGVKDGKTVELKKGEHDLDQKQAEAYKFWSKQSELNKSLFSLETILVNEVGTLDGHDALERTAVAKVVFNRYYDDFYNRLEKSQQITKYLKPSERNEKWLNVDLKNKSLIFVIKLYETIC